MYKHYFLDCKNCQKLIPIPQSSQVGTGDNPQAMYAENRKAVFACRECGVLSAYSSADQKLQMLPIQDPFAQGGLILLSIDAQCDGKSCEAPKKFHVVSGNGVTEFQKQAAKQLSHWKVSETARCDGEHKLVLNSKGLYYACREAGSPL